MKIDDTMWKMIQDHLGYSDKELKVFRENPNNADIMSKVPALMKKTIVITVVSSHGCNSRHKEGDKFFFDGAGNLITKLNPKRICIHALSALSGPIYAAHELFYAGADPNKMRLNRVGCFDVGLRCGGWGNIAMEIKVVNRNS